MEEIWLIIKTFNIKKSYNEQPVQVNVLQSLALFGNQQTSITLIVSVQQNQFGARQGVYILENNSNPNFDVLQLELAFGRMQIKGSLQLAIYKR